MIGTSLDRYTIVDELGHGGMSVVYRGRDTSLERDVALKVLHPHLAKKIDNRRRFHREAKAIARLRHPNILEIYDFSTIDADKSYIVMEYVSGKNLRQFLAEHGPPPAEVAALIGIEICRALRHAHEHGIIHRDLKPENVMVSKDGVVKLMDFGIAHVIDAETMTATGSLLGSPAHMAPEVIDGERVDVRADIFALGTVLFWLASGELPFSGKNAPQVLRAVLEGRYDELGSVEPKAGEEFASIVSRCMARDPADRYPKVYEVEKVLTKFAGAANLDPESEDLKAYFEAPRAFSEEFEDELLSTLFRRAREMRVRGDIPTAIALLNRVLAYQPDNEEVQEELEALARRSFPLWAVGGVIVLFIASVGLFIALSDPAPEQADVVEPVLFDPSPALSAVDSARTEALRVAELAGAERLGSEYAEETTEQLLASVDAGEAPKIVIPPVRNDIAPIAPGTVPPETTPDAGRPQVEEAVTYKYRFKVIPAAASFYINSRPIGLFKAASGIELEPGIHELEATSPGCKKWKRRLRVEGPQGSEPLPVVLEWEDGKVRVFANRPAVIWLGDEENPRKIGAAGKNATLRFPFGPSSSLETEKVVKLTLAPQNRVQDRQVQRVSVRPGMTSTLNVNFN